MKPFRPVFIIGPGRSGSTLLYKMLALHQDIGYISNYDARFYPGIATPLLSRFVTDAYDLKRWSWFNSDGNANTDHREWRKKLVPTPIEGEDVFTRVGLEMKEQHAPEIVARLRGVLARLQSLQNSDVLLSKCTANNVRVPTIAAACPEAKYIFLLRDGRAVAHSLIRTNWWNNHQVWWANHKTPLQLQQEGWEMLAIAARTWTEEMKALTRAIEEIPANNIQTIRFETLVDSPLTHLNSILEFIGVPARDAFLETIRKLEVSSRPEAWTKWSAHELNTVMNTERECLESLGYV